MENFNDLEMLNTLDSIMMGFTGFTDMACSDQMYDWTPETDDGGLYW